MLAGVFDVGAETAPAGEPAATFTARATGTYVLAESRTAPLRLVRTAETIARFGIDAFGVRLTAAGAVVGRLGRQGVDCRADDVVFIDLLETLDLRLLADGHEPADLTLWVPRARMQAALGDAAALHGLVVPGSAPAGVLIGQTLKALFAAADGPNARELDAMADGVLALIGKALGPLLATRADGGAQPALASFVTIRRYIDRNLRSPALDANALARTFGLSRAALYRLFGPVGGVASYVRQTRLERAYHEIVAADHANRRIGPIAYGLGFRNVSAFNRLFRDTYGESPRQARARVLTGSQPSPPDPEPDPTCSLAGWLKRIGARPAAET